MTEYVCSNCFPQKSIPKNINKLAALEHVGENAVDAQDGGSCHNKPVRLQETSSRAAAAPLLLQETRPITDRKGVCLNRALFPKMPTSHRFDDSADSGGLLCSVNLLLHLSHVPAAPNKQHHSSQSSVHPPRCRQISALTSSVSKHSGKKREELEEVWSEVSLLLLYSSWVSSSLHHVLHDDMGHTPLQFYMLPVFFNICLPGFILLPLFVLH